jgi:DNA repair protein RadC
MSRFSEHPTAFLSRRTGSFELTAQEQATIFAARAILARHINCNPALSSWQAVMDYCALSVRGEVERFHVLYLDRKNRLISDERLGVGTVDHVPVYPREVVRRALDLNASALILVHNHPSGDPKPSEADIAMTKEVEKACGVLGLTLHDHIIVGAGREVSLRELGHL